MKKRLIFMVTFVILAWSSSDAQDLLTLRTESKNKLSVYPKENERKNPVFEFKASPIDYDLDGISKEIVGTHLFGEIIAKKCYLLDDKYTSQVTLSPGNPATKTVIKKPVIYESVKRIEHDLKRSVRKGEIPMDKAVHDFNKVLDVALNILTSDTKDFESAIKSSGNTNSKIDLFTKRVILNY